MKIERRAWRAVFNGAKSTATTRSVTEDITTEYPQVGDLIAVHWIADNASSTTPVISSISSTNYGITWTHTTGLASQANANAGVKGGISYGWVTTGGGAAMGTMTVTFSAMASNGAVVIGVRAYSGTEVGTASTTTYTNASNLSGFSDQKPSNRLQLYTVGSEENAAIALTNAASPTLTESLFTTGGGAAANVSMAFGANNTLASGEQSKMTKTAGINGAAGTDPISTAMWFYPKRSSVSASSFVETFDGAAVNITTGGVWEKELNGIGNYTTDGNGNLWADETVANRWSIAATTSVHRFSVADDAVTLRLAPIFNNGGACGLELVFGHVNNGNSIIIYADRKDNNNIYARYNSGFDGAVVNIANIAFNGHTHLRLRRSSSSSILFEARLANGTWETVGTLADTDNPYEINAARIGFRIATNGAGGSAGIAGINVSEVTDTPKSGSDSGNLTATETASVVISAAVAGSDSGNLTSTETVSSIASTSTVSDSGNLTATETATVLVTVSTSDSGNLTAVESGSVQGSVVPVSGSDTGNITSAETASLSVIVAASDSGNLTSTETATLLKTTAASDSGNLTSTETAGTIVSTTTTSDSGNLTSTETATILVTVAGSDSGNLTAVEATTLTGSNSVSGSDSGNLTSTETATVFVTIVANDSGTISGVESATMFKAIAASDSGNLTSTETSAVLAGRTATDTGNLTSVESGTVEVSGGLDKTGSDTGSLTSTETASLTIGVAGSDAGNLTGAETATLASSSTATDSGVLSAVESATVFKTTTVSDSGNLTSTETSAIQSSRAVSDSGNLTAVESASVEITGTVVKSGSDSGNLTSVETSVVVALVVGADSGDLTSTETVGTIPATTTTTDSGVFSATETATVIALLTTADAGNLTAVESASLLTIAGYTVKAWNGTNWVTGILKVWNGSAWINPTVRRWNGTTWV